MRKIYLFLAGALLCMPAYSQYVKFERHAEDARQIFHQDFEVAEGLTTEEAYDNWAKVPIDTIHEIEYYARLGTGTPSGDDGDIYNGSADWQIFMVRTDSTSSEHTEVQPGDGIVMFNGVEQTSSKDEKKYNVYANDKYAIVGDGGLDDARNEAFRNYGENGGKYFFKYTTGDISKAREKGYISSSHYTSSTRSTKKYRRDLYIRGLDIEDESSYRLTFYIKTKKLNTFDPIFYADLMRGYHHQRANFSMGYKSGKDFSFTKDDFEDGKWERVTIMNYYINAHEADAYVMYKGEYSWTDDWTWRPTDAELQAAGKSLPEGAVLNYIKQPDKFFIRMAFATDSVEYSLDNITLTKSWIGGCEYNGDILRVNFGYDTNLDDIVKAEKAATNMPAVEVPNLNGKYFEVWCKKGDVFTPMPIRSAEYHDDGYMYLFTSYYPVDKDDPEAGYQSFKFGDYDSVFVTFHNPVDIPELTLKYTGDLYPKATDTAWVNRGKIVPSFYNEVAVPNPTSKIWAGVSSLDGLEPVMTKAPFEEGAFGLDPGIRELRFKFQKEIRVDKVFDAELDTGVVAYVGTEVWIPSWDAATSSLVITRPVDKTDPLSGDYKIELIQIKGLNGDAGSDVIRHYHFGSFSTRPSEASEYTHSDWRSTVDDPSFNGGSVAPGTWSHSYDSSAEQFERGVGQEAESTKCRMYILTNSGLDNCGYYVSPRNKSGNGKAKYSGNLYALVNFTEAGNYIISFKCADWWNADGKTNDGAETHLYFYQKPSGDEAGFTFETFSGVKDKTELGSFGNLNTHVLKSQVKDVSTGSWPEGVDKKDYSFTVTTPGEYIFEWCVFFPSTISSSSNGFLIGNYTIGKPADSDLSTMYVKSLINAVASAQARLASLTDDKYKGPDYKALCKAAEEGDVFVGNYPSQYDSVVANINASIQAMNLRMDTVNLFHSTETEVATLLESFTGDSVKYKDLATYQALYDHKVANASWIDSVKTTRAIGIEIANYKAEMKALNSRMSLIGKFNDKIDEVKAIMDGQNARKDYDEYVAMTIGYDDALKQDVVLVADSVITAATATLNAIKNEYVFRFDYEIAKTRQIKELYALVDTLGYDFAGFGGNKDSIKTLINALGDDDPELSNILREAAILQIYKYYAENKGEELEGFDVSALIPNYFLYNEAKVDRDMDVSSAGTWRIIKSKANTTAFPGWTVYSEGTLYPGESAMDWENEGHVFIGGLRYSATTGYIKATIAGLPQAYYQVGFSMVNNTISSSSNSTCSYKAVTSTDSVEIAGKKFSTKQVVYIDDSIRVKDGSTLSITYSVSSKSTSGDKIIIDGAVLKLTNPDTEANYAGFVTTQEAKLNRLITVVAPATANTSVQYYNLSGMQINAPKAGEIVIRKTVQGGKVVVDKVLIK